MKETKNDKQIETLILKYLKKKYKYDFKDEYYISSMLHLNKITLIFLINEENDKKIESILGIKGSDVSLTGSKLYNLPYESTDYTLRKAILLKTEENLKEFSKIYKKLPESIAGGVFNKYEEINGNLDISMILYSSD